jgi:hypothetical protein
VSLATIEQLLLDWRDKLDLSSQNILDLQNFATYQRLAGEAGFPPARLSGDTAAQVQPALDAMNGLFQHFELLAETLNQAQTLRSQIGSKRGQDEKVAEIIQLLTGESIVLPLVAIPLAQRSLLSASQDSNCIKPIDLMMAMVKSFETARDVVLAVDRAWATLEPKLTQSFQQIQAIQDQAQSCGLVRFEQLTQAAQSLTALHDRVASDPLGVADEFETTIAPLIATAQVSLAQVRQQQQQIHAGIAQAGDQMRQLEIQHQQALSQYQAASEKIQDCNLSAPLAPETIAALTEWQQTLAQKLAAGMVQPLVVGLQNWQAKFEVARSVTEAAIAAATQVLNQREELRGRLSALQAKAQARGRIEDPELVDLAAQSQAILFSRPSDLVRANDCLIQYDRRLNELIRASSG